MGAEPGDDSGAELKLDEYLPYRLATASSAVSGVIARAYQSRFGLTIPQWRLVCVLASVGRLTQAQLVSRTFMDKVTVSRAAQGLVRRRLVERSDNASDGRSHVLSLTADGRRLFADLAPVARAYEEAVIAQLEPSEVQLLRRLLGRLQAAAVSLGEEAEP
jgi:DNA-binding MarR family transcriptional regulator